MLRSAFHALMYWAPVLIICLAIGARAAAPYPYGSKDTAQILTESLSVVARELQDKGTVYVTVDGSDPDAGLLSTLNTRPGAPTFTPGKARSLELEHCQVSAKGGLVVGGCMQDNFLSAELLSMPLWHAALVRVKTAGCTAELALVQGNTDWHVVSQRTSCRKVGSSIF